MRIEECKEEGKISVCQNVKRAYENAKYGIFHHSAVQICSWTKKALRGKGVCYKQRFYGIDCHRCAQVSPSFAWCQQNCIFCWRPMEWMRKIKMEEGEIDDPNKIIKELVRLRKKLLSGIGGAEDVNRDKFKESFEKFPSHWAISLSGEPTIYPKLGEMIEELKKNPEVKSIFLVTNGQEPERLRELMKNNQLPTQLYLSMDAPNKEIFSKVNHSLYPDGWERLQKSLELLSEMPCRTVIRFTVIKGINDGEDMIKEYAKLFEKGKPDFIEIKAYMYLGLSRERLKEENMPDHRYIKEISKRLLNEMKNYKYQDEQEASRIVLLKRKDSKVKENRITHP